MSGDRTDELRHHAEVLARQFLLRAAFDFNAPDPRLAWEVFKEFAAAPMPEPRTITIGYEAYQAADRDRILWLSFVRSVEASNGVGWHVGYVLSRGAPDSLIGVRDSKSWWPEHSTLQTWFADVESAEVFQECLALDGWMWEGFSD